MRPAITIRRARVRAAVVLALSLAAGACSPDRVTNVNRPTPEAAATDPLRALRLSATGILAADRAAIAGYVTSTGQFGRELYNISPTESRSVTAFYQNFSDPAGQSTGGWSDRYAVLRNVWTFSDAVDRATLLSPPQQAGARGFARTVEALQLLHVVTTRHNLGAVVQILPDAHTLAPFVSRDSAYRYVAARLDSGYAYLQAAGTTPFPFVLPTGAGVGFGGFETPAAFATFNRALKARVEAYRASLGGRSPEEYQRVLSALDGSFLRPLAADRSNLKLGPQYVFGNVAGDPANGLTPSNTSLYAHPSIRDDGTVSHTDRRYVAKILPGRPLRVPAESTTPTDLGFAVYPTLTTPIPIIDNEELVLLRAEARWFTGDPAGALADVNLVRTISGGLAARGAFASESDFVTELLDQRRLSLLLQGHRWVDVRRFGRLATLPPSGPAFALTANQVVPQAECLARDRTGDARLACPAFTAE